MKTLKIELLKLRHSKIFLIPVIFSLFALISGKNLASNMISRGMDMEPWFMVYTGSMFMYATMLLPVLIIVIMAMLTRIEHSNNSWKQLLAFPIEKRSVYISKLIIGMLLVLLSVITLSLGITLTGILLGIKSQLPLELIYIRPLYLMVASLPIISIQYYLSVKYSKIAIPLGIGAIFTLPTVLITNSERFWIYYPWTYPSTAALVGGNNKTFVMYTISIILFIIVIGAGLREFCNRDVV